mmetsp:Transcript_34211/g.75882  ORF Transcript_34211/g.75882 Transcript_34211/m.75882 type:complete len:243 (-) Transcript_34211:1358-2086(-)
MVSLVATLTATETVMVPELPVMTGLLSSSTMITLALHVLIRMACMGMGMALHHPRLVAMAAWITETVTALAQVTPHHTVEMAMVEVTVAPCHLLPLHPHPHHLAPSLPSQPSGMHDLPRMVSSLQLLMDTLTRAPLTVQLRMPGRCLGRQAPATATAQVARPMERWLIPLLLTGSRRRETSMRGATRSSKNPDSGQYPPARRRCRGRHRGRPSAHPCWNLHHQLATSRMSGRTKWHRPPWPS